MADTRMVVLALSPRAAQAVEEAVVEHRCSIAPEYMSGDEEAVATAHLLEAVRDELQSQLADLAPEKIAALAERMAQAGLDAVAL